MATDVAWKWTFLITYGLAVFGAVYAAVHRNKAFATLAGVDYLSDPSHCPVGGGPSRRLLSDEQDFKPTFFLHALGICTGVSLLGGLALGLSALLLVRAHPHAMVGGAVVLQIALPAAAGAAVVSAGGGLAAAPLFITACLVAYVFWLYREQLALVGRLLSVAAAALWDNAAAIVGGSLVLQAAGLLAALPLLLGFVAAFANGGVIPNPGVTHIQGAICTDAQGSEVLCCSWMPDGWAIGYMGLAGLALGWTSLLAFTLKVYTVSGITAQWYFSPALHKPRGSLSTSLRHAFGPSFGSLCLSAWLLNLLQLLKSMAASARRESNDNLLLSLLLSCVDFLLSLLEAVTKFAVVRMAITGEALGEACASTSSLLSRNLLDSVGVWWLPGMVLQVTGLLLAGGWGLAVFGASYAAWGGTKVALASGAALGASSFVFGLVAISYLNSVLLNVVDAAYICFAMDRDAAAVTRPEVHAVYVLLPANKAPHGVVEQPDGGYAYGAAPSSAVHPAYPAVPRV